MKDQFAYFFPPAREQHEAIWKNALFVFDDNIILSLYRYTDVARAELLTCLELVKARTWIPHQVALEFFRNRTVVIKQSLERFSAAKKAVKEAREKLVGINNLKEKAQTWIIDNAAMLTEFDESAKRFLDSLAIQQGKQQTADGLDPTLEKIDALFKGRVGPAVKNADTLHQIYKESETRMEAKIPPGYEDEDKANSKSPSFGNGGLVYQRMHGDFLLWHQILTHVSSLRSESVIFVTNDTKEDWWDGKEPRFELREEMYRVGGAKAFLMSDFSGFVWSVNKFLLGAISESTIKEVREVASATEELIAERSILPHRRKVGTRFFPWYRLVEHWSRDHMPDAIIRVLGHTRYIAMFPDGSVSLLTCFELKTHGSFLESSQAEIQLELQTSVASDTSRQAVLFLARDPGDAEFFSRFITLQLAGRNPPERKTVFVLARSDASPGGYELVSRFVGLNGIV